MIADLDSANRLDRSVIGLLETTCFLDFILWLVRNLTINWDQELVLVKLQKSLIDMWCARMT